ncbi:unnamed protein product [Dovyalis caffra]|uniref:SHSP domain-containing protein n=1 Tax=Dovyalis caffra TaxID=77055 RepID=A0AAV1QWG3_9ROSI|nr:unnamed protein product [Dovyalis caffra]
MMNPRDGYDGYRSGGYNPISGCQPVRITSQNLQSTFQPKTEWKDEDAALVLLLHLPCFLKEQVRIMADESLRYVRVYGERLLTSKIRRRFDTGYNIPKNCDLMSRMKSEIAGGILTIRIPKNILGLGELEATTSQESPRAQDTTTTGQQKPEKKVEKEAPSGRTSTSFVQKETEGKDVSQKDQDESPQKSNVLSNTTKQLDEKTAGLDGEKVDQNVIAKKENNEAYGKPIEEEKPEKVVEKEEEKNEKIEESKIAESVVLKKKEEEEKNEGGAGGDKDKSNKDVSQESTDMEHASASANKSDKDVGMVDDKYGSVINIYVGVSLILALGAHFHSIFRSSRNKP